MDSIYLMGSEDVRSFMGFGSNGHNIRRKTGFLANIVTPDGRTIAQWAVPQIERAYVEGKMPSQLMLTDAR